MYPVIQHPEQDKAARDKLAALEKKTGKKPNILIFLLDDVGWMDLGFNGGGVAVGNATPKMDACERGTDPHLGLLDAVVLADARDDSDRPEPAAPRLAASADVWRARRARRRRSPCHRR